MTDLHGGRFLTLAPLSRSPARVRGARRPVREVEHEKFGKDGFEGMVTKVAEIEKRLGIFDL